MGGACSDWRPAVRGSEWLVGKPRSQPEVRQASVIVWTTTEWPEVLAVGLGDGQVVDARVAAPHEPVAFELPVFVADRKYRSEEHTSELQSPDHLLCPLLLEKKKHN